MQGRDDVGKLVLRVTVGLLLLLHGIAKVVHGLGYVEQVLGEAGLPAIFAWGAYVGEVLAPIMLIAGFWTRPAAIIVAINMATAVFLSHSGDLFKITGSGGWALELQGLYLFGAVAIFLLGAGHHSVDRVQGR